MKVLSKEIQEFLQTIRKLNTVGCVTVPKKNLDELISFFQQASTLLGPKPALGRVTYYQVGPKGDLKSLVKPALLVVTEEDYSEDPKWREEVRAFAHYFLNVK